MIQHKLKHKCKTLLQKYNELVALVDSEVFNADSK